LKQHKLNETIKLKEISSLFHMQDVFGFCISDCSGTGSNANAAQAVQIMSDLKTYSNGQFLSNRGAFF
jgi:hypothetical protein